MRRIGFSTGALARGDFRAALTTLRHHGVRIAELSALRIEELSPLMGALASLDLTDFTYLSIHAPSGFTAAAEPRVIDLLNTPAAALYPLVVHPDILFNPVLWRPFGSRLLIENMDKRKAVGRTASELRAVFDHLPEARFCFDIAHARQVDPTMTEASLMLQEFSHLLSEVHISEVNTASRHEPISLNAIQAFQKVARYIPNQVPIILESLIDNGQSELGIEIARARDALTVLRPVAA